MEPANANPAQILSTGTKIVTLVETRDADGKPSRNRGTVGVIVQSPSDYWHAYRIQFPDGGATSLKRAEFSVLRHFQDEGIAPADIEHPLAVYDLYQHVIFRCVIGSRAYGLDHDASDTDRRGVYLPPAAMHWSLFGVPEQLENDAAQEVYWELQKFLVLALKSNPNVLECLYSPIVEHATPLAREMLDMRESFLSKMIYQTYNGYVMSQFKKLQADLRNKGEVKWKHVMHLIRLLLSGIGALRDGVVPVDVGSHRPQLLAIRNGQMPWDDVEKWRLSLHRELDAAFIATKLPDRPDYDRANALLLKARRLMVAE
jgi:hypothetical protein